MAAVRHLGFGADWDHPRRLLDGLVTANELGLALPPKWGAMSTKPQKGTSLRESASFEPSSVKIRRRV